MEIASTSRTHYISDCGSRTKANRTSVTVAQRHGMHKSICHFTSSITRPSVKTYSHHERTEIQIGFPGSEPFYEKHHSVTAGETSFDVLGLGQAMIDLATNDERLLETLEVSKGNRKIISAEERTSILQSLEAESYKVEAGGSLSNTLMCLSRLSSAAVNTNRAERPLKVAMAGLVGSDALGSFYSAQMQSAGVQVVSKPTEGALTGTVVVVTSPSDAQRTFLSYLGTPSPVHLDEQLERAIANTSVLIIEGYLWEIDQAQETILKAIEIAKSNGTLVAMTAGDAGVVHRHHPEIWQAIISGIDILFTNAQEATALVEYMPEASQLKDAYHDQKLTEAERSALALGPYCSMVCVTDGADGSVMTALGQLNVVPPHWTENKPVDTCGAGDAYAAGVLYGLLQQFDVVGMGRIGARLASSVIARQGATLHEDSALKLAKSLPMAAERASLGNKSINTNGMFMKKQASNEGSRTQT